MVRLFCITVVSLLYWTASALAEGRVSVQVDPKRGAADEIFQLLVSVKNAETASSPELQPSPDFEVAYLGSREELTIINGSVNRRSVYQFQLKPKLPGVLSTPSGTVTIDGEEIPLPSQKITVEPTSPDRKAASSDYFIRQTLLARDFAYVGEQLVNTIEIGTSVPLHNHSLGDLNFPNFRTESIDNTETTRTMRNGKVYNVTKIQKSLFPLVTGTVTIPERTSTAQIRKPLGRSHFPNLDPFNSPLFDDLLGGGKLEAVSMTSNPLSIEVREVPPVPEDLPILGGTIPVGKTTIELRYPPEQIKFGEQKTVQVLITSEGNIAPINSLEPSRSTKYKIYEESPRSSTEKLGDRLQFAKVFTLSVVPRVGGQIEIPPFRMSYLDPESGTYRTISTDPITFLVIGEPPPQPTVPAMHSQSLDESTPSLLDRFLAWRERTVSGAMLWYLAALLAATTLAIRILRPLRARAHWRRDLTHAITSAPDAASLQVIVLTKLKERFKLPGDGPLITEVRSIGLDPDQRYSLEMVLDMLDEHRFAKSKGQASLESVKQQIIALFLQF